MARVEGVLGVRVIVFIWLTALIGRGHVGLQERSGILLALGCPAAVVTKVVNADTSAPLGSESLVAQRLSVTFRRSSP